MDNVELELSVSMLCILLNVSSINFCYNFYKRVHF